MPGRGELLVEGHQALHLEPAAEQPDDQCPGQPAGRSAGGRGAHEVRQPGVVEAHLGDAAAPGDLQRAAHQSLVDAVGGLADPAHGVQRQLSAVRDEVHDRAELSVGRPRQQVQIARSHRGLEVPHAHREADQTRSLGPPLKLQSVDLVLEPGVEVTAVAGDDLPAAALEPVHRLAQLAHGAALQRELRRFDHGLLADAQRGESKAAVARQVAGGCPPQHDPPPAGTREREEVAEHERD